MGSTLNPASIVIGGGVSAAGEFLREKLKLISINMPFQLFVTQVKLNLLFLEMMPELSALQVLLLNLKENNFDYYYH